jgi:hypothetical protein
MENTFISIEELKKRYPDEWILLGDPEIQNTTVLGGVVLFHSKDKKEVCYIGRDKTAGYSTVTIAFAGDLKQNRKILTI